MGGHGIATHKVTDNFTILVLIKYNLLLNQTTNPSNTITIITCSGGQNFSSCSHSFPFWTKSDAVTISFCGYLLFLCGYHMLDNWYKQTNPLTSWAMGGIFHWPLTSIEQSHVVWCYRLSVSYPIMVMAWWDPKCSFLVGHLFQPLKN